MPGNEDADQLSRNQPMQNVWFARTQLVAAPPVPKSGMTGPAAASAAITWGPLPTPQPGRGGRSESSCASVSIVATPRTDPS